MSGFAIQRPATAFSLSGRNSKTRKQPRLKSDGHLKWLRTLPSLVPGDGPVEAAHIRYSDPRYAKPMVGMAEKPDDKWAIPLSASEHRRQHSMNERDYWDSVGIDPVIIAALLWCHTGDDEAAIQVISRAHTLSKLTEDTKP
jgi:hypothetical protein